MGGAPAHGAERRRMAGRRPAARAARARVCRGARTWRRQAGAVVVGGHTITDPEPKYGMVAFGLADADRLVRNSTAAPGDAAGPDKAARHRNDLDGDQAGERDRRAGGGRGATMTTLNAARPPRRWSRRAPTRPPTSRGSVCSATCARCSRPSGVAARVDAALVPLLPGALDLAQRGVVPGGTRRNHAFARRHDRLGGADPARAARAGRRADLGRALDRDPSPRRARRRARARAGVAHAAIGEVVAGDPGHIAVDGRLAADQPE